MRLPSFLHRRVAFALTLLAVSLCLLGCHRPPPPTVVPARPDTGTDAIRQEILSYRAATRSAFNQRQFDQLEQNAAEARSSKEKFGNGSWKIAQFYESFGLVSTELESTWKLHEAIHQAWVAAMPASITARVAQADFLADYAWHARGGGYADTVTAEGARLMQERLAVAQQALVASRDFAEKCPVWWRVALRVGLGQGWSRTVYDRVYAEGKAYEPLFWGYDVTRSIYLATKWYGEPGDWEDAANEASADPAGLGLEIYARCVAYQITNYQNVFDETNATWAKTKEGFELMRQRYPDSFEVASSYCRLACIARDRPTAKMLFDLLGENAFSYLWPSANDLQRDRAWAEAKE